MPTSDAANAAGDASDGAGDADPAGDADAAGDPSDASDAAGDAPDAAGDASDAAGSTLATPCGKALNGTRGEFWDLGHTSRIRAITRSRTRMLSLDSTSWVLWNLEDGSNLASGFAASEPRATFGQLQGDLVAVEDPVGTVQLRNASDGLLRTNLAVSGTGFGVAIDGSYVWSASSTQLTVWDGQGKSRGSRPGNYSQSKIVGHPDALRIAVGPAGANVIERIDALTLASTTSTFSGTFYSWFIDGNAFLSITGNVGRTLPKDGGAPLGVATLPMGLRLVGQGSHIWTYSGGRVDVYSISSSGTPIGSIESANAEPYPSGLFAAVATYTLAGGITPTITVLSFAGGSFSFKTSSLPLSFSLSSWGADETGRGTLGTGTGLLLDGSDLSRPSLSCGAVGRIAGASDGTFALASAAGTLLGKADSAQAKVDAMINFPSDGVDLSTDGRTLAAAATGAYSTSVPDRTVKVFALPQKTETHQFPAEFRDSNQFNSRLVFDLSDDGVHLLHLRGTVQASFWTAVPILEDLSGGTSTSLGTVSTIGVVRQPFVSPNGVSVASIIPWGDPSFRPPPTTNLYRNGTLVEAIQGPALGWLDNDRLLATTHAPSGIDSVDIYTSLGQFVSSTPLPTGIDRFQSLGGDRIYVSQLKSIFSLTASGPIWTSSEPASPNAASDVGAVAGENVISLRGSRLITERF